MRVVSSAIALAAGVVLVGCSGPAPLAPSSASAGIAGASSLAASQGVVVTNRDGSNNGSTHDDGTGHDVNNDNGQDRAGHDAVDDRGQDAAGHDAADDRGQDAAGHDARDDNGQDAAGISPRDANDANEVLGTVSQLIGGCPNLTFNVGATTVTTSTTTRFRDVACRDLANGIVVEAKGVLAGSTLAASDIQRKR